MHDPIGSGGVAASTGPRLEWVVRHTFIGRWATVVFDLIMALVFVDALVELSLKCRAGEEGLLRDLTRGSLCERLPAPSSASKIPALFGLDRMKSQPERIGEKDSSVTIAAGHGP